MYIYMYMHVIVIFLPVPHTACYNINQWPAPRPGQIFQLPLLGILVHVRLPTKSDKPGSARGPDTEIARKSVSTAVWGSTVLHVCRVCHIAREKNWREIN